ncbi:ATP-binding protein, partial [Rickettsiales bacterium]|nr:ATP-binding protein [Rickettsiales bacterium]
SKEKNSFYSQKHLRLILDNISDAVITIDSKGIIESFNPSAERIFGYDCDEVIGKNISTLIASIHHTELSKFLKNPARIGQPTTIGDKKEINAIHKDKNTFPIEIGINATEEDDNIIIICVIRDITEQKKSDEDIMKYTDRLEWAHYEMLRAKDEAEKANQSKSAFLANMSHEIRTPLNAVMGMTELLMNTELTEKQDNYANKIYNSSEMLLALINDILDISKIEAGEMSLEEIPYSITKLIDEVYSILSPKIQQNKIDFSVNYDKNIHSDVKIDPLRFKQILINLAGNAVKFTSQGYVKIDVTAVKETKSSVTYLFEVKDSGIGIAKDKLKSIFDKFAQADVSTVRQFGGTGLGLAICKQLVELMQGSLGVRSDIGKGSVFWFKIKLNKQ